MAIAAGGLVIGLATAATLAAWTDTEWVFGGNAAGDEPGVGTSAFEVEQNVTAPFAAAGFVQDEENPGSPLTFGLDALSLSPGDSVYAPVALRTVDGSIGGTIDLQSAVAADGITVTDADGVLFGALELRVAVNATAVTCDAGAFTATSTIADGTLAAAEGNAAQALTADSGNTQYYCFELTLPDAPTLPTGTTLDDLQGRTVAPAWEFAAESE
jgi:predicted ribosomally synthesized peptide with SipW-like signal peptide